LSAYGELVGVDDPDAQLAVRRVLRWAGGEVVRFQVVEKGLPVHGHSVVVRLRGTSVTGVSGGRPDIAVSDRPHPVSTRSEIIGHVKRATGRKPSRLLGHGYLVVAGEARLVWRADAYLSSPPQRLLMAIDDRTGQILRVGPGFVSVQGKVYDPSPETGPPVIVDLTDLESPDVLEGTYARSYQCVGTMQDWPPCSPLEHNATPNADGNYLYEPIEPSASDMFSEVHGYYQVTEFNKWLASTFGFEWSCNGSRAIDVHVNLDYPNAFYGDANGDPAECADITLGQSAVDFAYDSEVIYHEFTHGMVDQTAALGCPDWGLCQDTLGVNFIAMGLNEGFADYFAMTYTDSPDLGEYVGSESGEPYLRTAINQNQCPWDVTSESHHDGQIWSGAVWTLRESFGVDVGDQLVYGALMSMPEDAEFAEAAVALIAAAEDLQAQGTLTAADVQTVEDVVGPNDRNMLDCYRIIPLDGRPAGKERAYGYGMQTYPGYLDELPIGLHWTVQVPEDGVGLRIHITPRIAYGSTWRVYLNEDQPASVQLTMGGTLVNADHEIDGSPNVVELDLDSDPQLVPGTLYHMVIVYSAQYGELFELEAEVETGTIEPDASVMDAAPVDSSIPVDGSSEVDAAVADSGPTTDPDVQISDSLSPRGGCNCTVSAQGDENGSSGYPLGVVVVVSLLGMAALIRRR
jgi:Zn-dependent metalloprotease